MNTVNKFIKINCANYRVETNDTIGATCGQCAFYSGKCPTNATGVESCWEFGEDAYFVSVPSKSLVEEFKEAAGIQTEKTYTRQQVWDAYFDWTGDSDTSTRFCDHIEKYSDPEYTEFLRLKEKFA